MADIAYDPDARGRHHADKLKKAMGFTADPRLYYALIPVWDISTSTRMEIPIPFDLPFYRLYKDHKSNPQRYKPIESEGSVDYTSAFCNHKVVKESGIHRTRYFVRSSLIFCVPLFALCLFYLVAAISALHIATTPMFSLIADVRL